MSRFLFLIIVIIGLSFSADKPVEDYLGCGVSIDFYDKNFTLAWSSNPSEGYYKQEYLTDSTTIDNYHEMLMIEAIIGNISADDAAFVKVAELVEWKKSNPIINWNVYKKDSDRVIDFVVTDGGVIFEWNIYRYQLQKINKRKTLTLYAYSYKDSVVTKDDLTLFFDRIVSNRTDVINRIGALELNFKNK